MASDWPKELFFKDIPVVMPPSVPKDSVVWKSKYWSPDEIPKKLLWSAAGMDPFVPILVSLYEEAEESLKAAIQQVPTPFLFLCVVIAHDCSEQVPFGHGMLTALTWLVGQWKLGMAEVRYIAVGKGDLDRYAQAVTANAQYTSEPGFLAKDPYYFKGIPVREHDQRAGYYLLVCY